MVPCVRFNGMFPPFFQDHPSKMSVICSEGGNLYMGFCGGGDLLLAIQIAWPNPNIYVATVIEYRHERTDTGRWVMHIQLSVFVSIYGERLKEGERWGGDVCDEWCATAEGWKKEENLKMNNVWNNTGERWIGRRRIILQRKVCKMNDEERDQVTGHWDPNPVVSFEGVWTIISVYYLRWNENLFRVRVDECIKRRSPKYQFNCTLAKSCKD